MKNLNILIRKICRIGLFAGLSTLLLTNCTEDTTLDELQPEIQQKAFHMLPAFQAGDMYIYKGMVNNDSIEIIIPAGWNESFIVYAHGYVDPILPIALPIDKIETTAIKDLIVSQGYGYAATSYSENGFAVKEGIQDVLFLGHMLKAHFKPNKLFLGGVSEGGLIAIKTLEKYKNTFDAGLVSCGPIGNFSKQLQYFGNFHVLFNYFYAEELASIPEYLGGPLDLGSPEYVSPALMEAWSASNLEQPLLWVISQNEWKLPVLLNIANVPTDGVPQTLLPLLAKEILRFNIMATNDMIKRLHGIPFDNTKTTYSYSGTLPFNCDNLNINIMRIKGDKQAIHRVRILYETKGNPSVPIVFMHTLGDHVTPYWHITDYMSKVDPNRIGHDIIHTPIYMYGHCNYTLDEVLEGIGTMVSLAE